MNVIRVYILKRSVSILQRQVGYPRSHFGWATQTQCSIPSSMASCIESSGNFNISWYISIHLEISCHVKNNLTSWFGAVWKWQYRRKTFLELLSCSAFRRLCGTDKFPFWWQAMLNMYRNWKRLLCKMPCRFFFENSQHGGQIAWLQ